MGGQSDTPERTLDEADLPDDPLTLFAGWLGEAMEVERPEPTAMALATAGYDGSPSARMVLMRGFDERGIVWFTNYRSRKGRELDHSRRAAVVFYWGR
ncbi:MAG TPA: pyridoxamine 5'-phosphate oxidase family protein, partial [Acidimicrobiia bacterium]|nr:pyridoxamine 5'-phosphate oxidase family protein [Acidimicrobiia bacterium]